MNIWWENLTSTKYGTSLARMATTRSNRTRREAVALKQVIAEKLGAEVRRGATSKAALAREMGTSRSAVDRVLDPTNTAITLRTLVRAADHLGYRVKLSLEPRIDRVEPVSIPRRLRPLLDQLGQAVDKLARK
jgi:antitoxin HicB